MAELQPMVCLSEAALHSAEQEVSALDLDIGALVRMRRILQIPNATQEIPSFIAFGGIRNGTTLQDDGRLPYHVVQDIGGHSYPFDEVTTPIPTLQRRHEKPLQGLICPIPKDWSRSQIAAAVIEGHQQGSVQLDPDNHLTLSGLFVGSGTVIGALVGGSLSRVTTLAPGEIIGRGTATGLAFSSLVVAIPVISQVRSYRQSRWENRDRARRASHTYPIIPTPLAP